VTPREHDDDLAAAADDARTQALDDSLVVGVEPGWQPEAKDIA
jgi:hypothetical protein